MLEPAGGCQRGLAVLTEKLKGAGHCQCASALMSWLIFTHSDRRYRRGSPLCDRVYQQSLCKCELSALLFFDQVIKHVNIFYCLLTQFVSI